MSSDRKEIYNTIKKNNWQKEILDTFGRNMTQVSSEKLHDFIIDKIITKEAEEKEKKKEETSEIVDTKCRKAIISMLSCFEASNYLTNEEIEKILKELK